MKKKKSKKVHKGETAQEQFKALMKGEKNKK